jgi:hypothetical protein
VAVKAEILESNIHLTAIRRAFANGNAAVMVGAGFSRNAEGGDNLSTWADLAKELAVALDPSATREHFSTSNVTQLAEQYARVFSTPALEQLLKRMVPDDRVVPGELHHALLSLNWSEIFTTNYDTLLERAANDMFERAHFTVGCPEDIPESKILGRRRIVKLHGSFPSHRPFIFTEEDYRTYPDKFAPFVNMVRQSLLENIFCLIGFSGDDPNFLNWIGWVRDMLDKHALPVYLFLDRAPNLGQRKLLEARGVVPVVLPEAPSDDPSDYSGRYKELFRILATPLREPQQSWGEVSWPENIHQYREEPEAKYQQLLIKLETLATHRKSYPAWLVAPQSVRRRFGHSLAAAYQSVNDHWALQCFATEDPTVVVAALEIYAWHQDVLLAPLDDTLAQLALRVLPQVADIRYYDLSEDLRMRITSLGVGSAREWTGKWTSLTFAILRWARQGLRQTEFDSICKLLRQYCPSNPTVEDDIAYQTILLNLYLGERDGANTLLNAWKVQGVDQYMHLRKAALLAELGDAGTALIICKDTIQSLRDSQRLRPDDTLLISQEAWACVIAEHIQRGLQVRHWISGDADSHGDQLIEGLNERLRRLATRGYDVKSELEKNLCALDAEAASPAEAKYRFAGFDLGESSAVKRFGVTTEFRSKVEAALEWLELAERVGLMTRAGMMSYYTESFLQAAWWTQYADTEQRVLSILFRTMSTNVLKPKDESLPPHKSGWLSRYQVAKIDLTTAEQGAERFLRQIESLLSSSTLSSDAARTVPFFCEVFSRLVLRVQNEELVLGWGQRIVEIHRWPLLQNASELWKGLAKALARCVEALPDALQAKLVGDTANVLLLPNAKCPEHRKDDWLPPSVLYSPITTPNKELFAQCLPLRRISEQLIQALEQEQNSHDNKRFGPIWNHLMWLDRLGVLDTESRTHLSNILWKNDQNWPVIPGYYAHVTFLLPAPPGIELGTQFKTWILQQKLRRFSESSGMILSRQGRSWGLPVSEDFLQAWSYSIERMPWSVDEVLAGVEAIAEWWRDEGTQLQLDLDHFEELRDAILTRFDLIDMVLATSMEHFAVQQANEEHARVAQAVQGLVTQLRAVESPMWRLRWCFASAKGDMQEMTAVQTELASILLQNDDSRMGHASRAAKWLIEHSEVEDPGGLDIIIDTSVALVSTRRLPGMIWALDILGATANRLYPDRLVPDRIRQLDVAMSLIFAELSYSNKRTGTGIVNDAVPLLRFQCARLAYALSSLDKEYSKNLSAWLSEAQCDPLPELRFGRYKRLARG